jgi:hypothetical protein
LGIEDREWRLPQEARELGAQQLHLSRYVRAGFGRGDGANPVSQATHSKADARLAGNILADSEVTLVAVRLAAAVPGGWVNKCREWKRQVSIRID